jgi:23S rRNA pseudouridine2604 synthase
MMPDKPLAGSGVKSAAMTEPLRLAKHVAQLLNCSRREAELVIEGGAVHVDGKVVESPQFRITDQTVWVDTQAKPTEQAATTVLFHKPAGLKCWEGSAADAAWMNPGQRASTDRSGTRLLQKHLKGQLCVAPLEDAASGLVVFTQDWRIQRKLVADRAQVENEVIVDVAGVLSLDQVDDLAAPPRGASRGGVVAPPFKVSLSRQSETTTGLRFAIKDNQPGRLEILCRSHGLTIMAMKRLRVGRLSVAGLESGQWRFLMPYERF